MRLRIDIIDYGSQSGKACSAITLDVKGGTIGRTSENDIVLVDRDKLISRRHGVISCEEGRYYLTDTSRNGILIYNKGLHLRKEKIELEDGDRIRIGEYELVVSFQDQPQCDPTVILGEQHFLQEPAATVVDLVTDFSKQSWPSEPVEPSIPDTEIGPGEPVQPHSGDDGDDTGSASQALAGRTGRGFRKAPRDTSVELFDLFLQGAGIEERDFFEAGEIPDLMVTLGKVFREMVNGLWIFLQGRAEQKSEMRALMTGVLNTDNNPLKLSPLLEDALRSLIKQEHRAFLAPVDAIHKGFEDLMNHHLAIIAGAQHSLTEVLDRFNPEHFAEKHKGGFALTRKSLCWDEYCQSFNHIRDEALDRFFGKAFVKAYEDQIEQLRSETKQRSDRRGRRETD